MSFEEAAHLYQALSENVTFDTAMAVDGRNIVVSAEEWNALKDEQRKQIYFNLVENAAKGNGFSFGRRDISENETNTVLNHFFSAINS